MSSNTDDYRNQPDDDYSMLEGQNNTPWTREEVRMLDFSSPATHPTEHSDMDSEPTQPSSHSKSAPFDYDHPEWLDIININGVDDYSQPRPLTPGLELSPSINNFSTSGLSAMNSPEHGGQTFSLPLRGSINMAPHVNQHPVPEYDHYLGNYVPQVRSHPDAPAHSPPRPNTTNPHPKTPKRCPNKKNPKSSAYAKRKTLACTWPGCTHMATCQSNLDQHEASHSGERQYLCEIQGCVKSFARPWSLSRHYRDVHKVNIKAEKINGVRNSSGSPVRKRRRSSNGGNDLGHQQPLPPFTGTMSYTNPSGQETPNETSPGDYGGFQTSRSPSHVSSTPTLQSIYSCPECRSESPAADHLQCHCHVVHGDPYHDECGCTMCVGHRQRQQNYHQLRYGYEGQNEGDVKMRTEPAVSMIGPSPEVHGSLICCLTSQHDDGGFVCGSPSVYMAGDAPSTVSTVSTATPITPATLDVVNNIAPDKNTTSNDITSEINNNNIIPEINNNTVSDSNSMDGFSSSPPHPQNFDTEMETDDLDFDHFEPFPIHTTPSLSSTDFYTQLAQMQGKEYNNDFFG